MADSVDLVLKFAVSPESTAALNRLVEAVEKLSAAVDKLTESEYGEDPEIVSALEDIEKASEGFHEKLREENE